MAFLESMPASSSPIEELTYSDSYNDPAGDCELISADGVRFRLMRYHVLSNSVGLRAVLADATPTPDSAAITFTDDEIESSVHIHAWLDVLHGAVQISTRSMSIDVLSALFDFADKWDCRSLTQYLVASLPTYLKPSTSRASWVTAEIARRIFALAAKHERADICEALLASRLINVRYSILSLGVNYTHRALDPAGFRWELYAAIPKTYMYALCRAWHAAVHEGEDKDWLVTHRVAQMFSRQLKSVQRDAGNEETSDDSDAEDSAPPVKKRKQREDRDK